jgi:hypothetical protein
MVVRAASQVAAWGGPDSVNQDRSSEDFGAPGVRLLLDRLGQHLRCARPKDHLSSRPGSQASPPAPKTSD